MFQFAAFCIFQKTLKNELYFCHVRDTKLIANMLETTK